MKDLSVQTILVDDEPLALQLLEQQLAEFNNVDIIETFTRFDIEKHTQLLQDIHVIFLDIEMPEINGLNLAEQILQVNPKIIIVFVTAFNEYAVQAFELNALDYLLKPVKKERLENTIERIEQEISDQTVDVLPTRRTLYITLCNEFNVLRSPNKQDVEIIHWRTQRAQELFIYLLYHAGETVSKAKLAELLWPGHEQERAFSQLYTAVYNIRKALMPYNRHLKIESVYEGYTMLVKNTMIDIVEWERKIKKLPPISEQVIDEYEQVMNLYTGPFLNNYNYAWADPERFRIGLLWLDAATQLADFYKKTNAIEKAIVWYEDICDYRPEDDHANLSIMKLHASLGYGMLVEHQYNLYKNTIDELGLSPGEDIDKWYKMFKSN